MSDGIGLPPGSLGGVAYDALTMARDANSKADRALQEINGHEDICAERYRTINEKLSMLFKIITWAGSTSFLLVMALLGFLAKTQFESISALQKAASERGELLARSHSIPPRVIIERPAGHGEMEATVEQR